MKLLFYFILSLFINISSGFSQCDSRYENNISESFILHKDIIYGRNVTSLGDTIDLDLDVFEPEIRTEEPRPLVILIHGGTFFSGSKENGEVVWFCEDLAKRGLVVASINYRLNPDILTLTSAEKMIKAVIRSAEDTKAAIRFFHKSVATDNEFNLDDEHFIVGGVSAGSIAALYAVFMDAYEEIPTEYRDWILELGIDSTLSGNSGNSGYSEKVAGLINISGGINAMYYLNNNADISLLNIHNDGDLTVPYKWSHPYQIPSLPQIGGSFVIHAKMKQLGGYSDLFMVPGIKHVPHTLLNGQKNYPIYFQCLDKIEKFLRHVIPCNELTTTVLEDVSENLVIYPNPSVSQIQIEGLSDLNTYSFELYDVEGKLYLPDFKFLGQSSLSLERKNIPVGIYYLQGKNQENETRFTKKIILQ